MSAHWPVNQQEGQRDQEDSREDPMRADVFRKLRSCRTQELTWSSAQENARQKKGIYRNQRLSASEADLS